MHQGRPGLRPTSRGHGGELAGRAGPEAEDERHGAEELVEGL